VIDLGFGQVSVTHTAPRGQSGGRPHGRTCAELWSGVSLAIPGRVR
jgi:hypothetical protein